LSLFGTKKFTDSPAGMPANGDDDSAASGPPMRFDGTQ
jgi:hypothetical protein